MENKELYKELISHFGVDDRLNLLCEELAELIQATSKLRRFGKNEQTLGHIAEELCDVEIMINQLKLMYPELDKKVIKWKVIKHSRIRGIISAFKIKENNNEQS